jgi:phosphatidate phosphatase APP1
VRRAAAAILIFAALATPADAFAAVTSSVNGGTLIARSDADDTIRVTWVRAILT